PPGGVTTRAGASTTTGVDADRKEVLAARADGRTQAVPATGHTRVRDDRWEERFARERRSAGQARATARGARQSAAAASRRRPGPDTEYQGTDAGIRAAAETAWCRGGSAAQPRPRYQRGVRPATGGGRR